MTEDTTGYDADHYVQRLDLGEDPFVAEFESEYFYDGGMRRETLNQLVHYCRFGDQVVMLVGASGSGTSLLLDQAMSVMEDVMDCCYIDGEQQSQPDSLLQALDAQLQLALPFPIQLADFFSALKIATVIDGEIEPVLIAVDQAHFVSYESFQRLRP